MDQHRNEHPLDRLARSDRQARFARFGIVLAAVAVTALVVAALIIAGPAHAAAPKLCGPWHWFGYCYGPWFGGQG